MLRSLVGSEMCIRDSPPSVPLIRRTLFTCGRVNPIAPSIAGRRREYQRSKRARLFRREYFKQSSSNFQIYLCKECPSRPAVSRSRNSKAHRRRISAVFSALLFIRSRCAYLGLLCGAVLRLRRGAAPGGRLRRTALPAQRSACAPHASTIYFGVFSAYWG